MHVLAKDLYMAIPPEGITLKCLPSFCGGTYQYRFSTEIKKKIQ